MKKETHRPEKKRTYKENHHIIDSQELALEEYQSLYLRLEEAIKELSNHSRSLPESEDIDKATIERLNVLKLYRTKVRVAIDALKVIPDEEFRGRRAEFAELFESAEEELLAPPHLNKDVHK